MYGVKSISEFNPLFIMTIVTDFLVANKQHNVGTRFLGRKAYRYSS
jgi:hypothetical protein